MPLPIFLALIATVTAAAGVTLVLAATSGLSLVSLGAAALAGRLALGLWR